MPKKCDRKKGTRRKFFTPGSVVLSTFRKQPALAHGTRKRWPQARQPPGSDSPKCFTLGLGRLAKFSHGNHASNFDSNLYPKPALLRSGPTPCTRGSTRKRWVQAKFWGTRLGLRKRPAGRTRMSEADLSRRSRGGRVCAVERTWP